MTTRNKKIKQSCITLLWIVLISCLSIPAYAAVYCARPSSSGSGSGADWNNAVALSTVLASSAYRGHTVYVSGENYGSLKFNAPQSGSKKIIIKKATATDHVTNTGWNSSWGTKSATFTRWWFDTGYWELNGQHGQGARAMYGVPSADGWKPYQEYGFKVLTNTTSSNADCAKLYAGNITIRHTEMGYTSTPGVASAWGNGNDIIQIYPNLHNITISYCWLHDASRVNIAAQYPTNFIVEYSVIERCGQAQAAGANTEHTELYSQQQGGNNTHFRYNLLRDWKGTGGLILHSETGAPGCANFHVYGNVFTTTGYYSSGGGNGVIAALNKESSTPHQLYVYNNTFVDVEYGCQIGSGKQFSVRDIKNNIFYNCKLRDTHQSAYLYGSSSYNWFFDSGTQSESGMEYGSGDPFVDRASGEYQLTDGTSAGVSLASTYNSDPMGITRAVDGNWDRGAFEYGGSSNSGGGSGTDAGPNIYISSPTSAGSYDTQQDQISLSGTASDDVDVSSVTWTCSECTPTSGTANGTESWDTGDINLANGENRISVTATDTKAQSTTKTLSVNKVVSGGNSGSDTTAPIISDKQPTGDIQYANPINMNVMTNEAATCRADTSKANYDQMLINMGADGEGDYHSVDLANLKPSTTYVYYVRCKDMAGNTSSATAVNFVTDDSSTVQQPKNLMIISQSNN